MILSAVSKVTLNNGVKMPMIGLGTFQARSEEVCQAIIHALDCGYTHIDTAAIYRNEKDIGEVLKQRGTKREDLFITSKIPPTAMSYEATLKSCMTSLSDLQTDYVDLMLIHWPAKSGAKKESSEHATSRREAWKALEELYEKGKCKAIGVSNYTVTHLEQMKSYWRVIPAVNQVECHPCLVQRDLREWCHLNNILVEAYSSLGQGDVSHLVYDVNILLIRYKLLKNDKVLQIAESHRKTAAQVLLRWGLQHNIVVIPKSITQTRIKSNIDLYDFSLSESDMNALDLLNTDYHYCWDPTDVL